jgi:hypothetical protein
VETQRSLGGGLGPWGVGKLMIPLNHNHRMWYFTETAQALEWKKARFVPSF